MPETETWVGSAADRELSSRSQIRHDDVEVRTKREQRSRAQCLQDVGPPSAPDTKTLEALNELTGASAANALLRQVESLQQDESGAHAVRVLYADTSSRTGSQGWAFGAAKFGLRSGRFVWVDGRGMVTKVQHWDEGWPNGVEAHWWGKSGKMKNCGILVDGMRHGEWTDWHENGQRAKRRNYDLDLEEGLSETWHPNGQRQSEQVFNEGVKDGPYRAWAPNGQLVEEGAYVEGEKDGVWTYHDDKGNVKRAVTWEKGKKAHDSFQPLNRAPLTEKSPRQAARRRASFNWQESAVHRRLTSLSETILEEPKEWQRRKRRPKLLLRGGGPRSLPEKNELMGLTGKSAALALIRQVRSMRSTTKLIYGMVPGPKRPGRPGDGPDGTTLYWREAAGYYFGATKYGLRSGRWVWITLGGSVVKVQHFEGGWLNGAAATWHGPPGESLASLGNYVDGMRHGVWTEWNRRGGISRRGNYNFDVKDGLSESWHPNGQLMEKGAYKKGEKSGVWVHHDEEGNLTRTETWEMGKKV